MRPTIPVFVFLTDNQSVYLQRRFNTDYGEGCYEPSAGKMDYDKDTCRETPQQAGCREVLEESGVRVDPSTLELFHAYINFSEGYPWMGLMFRTRVWQGSPVIMEPNKCDDAGFFDLNNLPTITPQVRDGLSRLLIADSIEMPAYF